jgi:hypothetical protein
MGEVLVKSQDHIREVFNMSDKEDWESLYHGTTSAFLTESQIFTKILERVSVIDLKASSGDDIRTVILSLKRVSNGSVWLDLRGVEA